MADVTAISLQGLRALFLFGLVVLGACSQPPLPSPHQLQGVTMGTTWSAKWYGNGDQQQLNAELQAVLAEMNRQMSTWHPETEISRYNHLAPGSWYSVADDFWQVLEIAFRWAEASDGLYDPTAGPLVNLWGFGPTETRGGGLPTEAQIDEARQRVGFRKVTRDAERKAIYQPGGIYLDLSSVAKGYAVDRLADVLDAHGISSYLVEIGGELKARGLKPNGQGWRIAVERPLENDREVGWVLELKDISIATSGDYRNVVTLDGVNKYSHTINPLTGHPVPRDLASVTVLHETTGNADALATMLTVMGADQGQAFAEQQSLAAMFIVRDGDQFRVQETAAFRRLLLN